MAMIRNEKLVQPLKEIDVEWVSDNKNWKMTAIVKENPVLPGRINAFRNVKIYRRGLTGFEPYSDDGKTPKYVMDKYHEFTKIIYEED